MKKNIFIFMMILLPIMLFSATWYVDQDGHGDFTSIAAAISSGNVANDDVIILEPDTYNENIVMENTRRLTIASRYYLDPQVAGYISGTKVCGNTGNIIVSAEDRTKLLLHGLSITGDFDYGVKIRDDANVSIEYCKIYELNEDDSYGIHYSTVYQQYEEINLEVQNCWIDDVETGIYMYYFEGAEFPDIGYNEIENCYTGIYSSSIRSYVHHNTVYNCHFGLKYVDGISNTEIEYNLLYENTDGINIYNAGNYYVNNCTIYGNTLGLKIREYCSADVNSSLFYNNTTEVSASNGSVDMLELFYCLIDETDIEYDYRDRISFEYCFDEDPEMIDPVNDDYRLDDTSPCIDRGDIARDDDDNSRRDVGYDIIDQDEFVFSGFGTPTTPIWKWLSFPRLPFGTTTQNTGQTVSSSYMREHWNGIPSSCKWYFEQEDPQYKQSGSYVSSTQVWTWTVSGSENVKSTEGYKIWRTGSGTCNLYSPGNKCEDDTNVSIAQGENWIGYFLEDSQNPADAFPSAVLDDLLYVRTQKWAWVKDAQGNWPTITYTINYGDCVIVDAEDGDYDFDWETPRSSEPVIRPVPEHYTFVEEADYQPVYVDFGENELPLEMAVFVDDVCLGAAVVDGQVTQLCAYLLECDPGLQVEFEFYYDNRQAGNRIQSYDIETIAGKKQNSNLETGMPGYVYYVSFRDLEFEVPVPPFAVQCYPNPFNPELTISFNLEETQEVDLVIYNSKGQKVKTMVNELFRPADYSLVWNGTDDSNHPVSSGVYFIRLQVGDDVVSDKVILMK